MADTVNIIFGQRRSRSAMVMGLLLMLQLFSFNAASDDIQSHLSRRRQLKQVEEKNIQAHPTSRHKHANTLIDEFLDENSPFRHVFFPDIKSAIDPIKDAGHGRYYQPGKIWLDTDGKPIEAHGGGVLYDENSHTFYWYGEHRSDIGVRGVGCYSSKDLWTWKHQGIVFSAEQINEGHDKANMLERPKVIHNDKTGKYVMWMHVDDAKYAKASVGIAVSDSPTGPFKYLGSKRPHGCESRDMTVFKDEDGVAYVIYSSNNNMDLHIGPLTDDYLDVQRDMQKILVGQHREAAALFKYRGTYYMITSACSGWAPNEALVHAAESIMGTWETMGDPCIGGDKMFRVAAFLSQSCFVIPLPGLPGSYVFMADRWNPAELKDSRYVWLPLMVSGHAGRPLLGFPSWPRVSIYWHNKWRLPLSWRVGK